MSRFWTFGFRRTAVLFSKLFLFFFYSFWNYLYSFFRSYLQSSAEIRTRLDFGQSFYVPFSNRTMTQIQTCFFGFWAFMKVWNQDTNLVKKARSFYIKKIFYMTMKNQNDPAFLSIRNLNPHSSRFRMFRFRRATLFFF